MPKSNAYLIQQEIPDHLRHQSKPSLAEAKLTAQAWAREYPGHAADVFRLRANADADHVYTIFINPATVTGHV